jgi:hypothetical protein
MTTYNHTHQGSSLPLTRPGGAQPVTYTGAWKDLLAILAVAIVMVAVFVGIFAAAGTSSTTTAVHRGGAHGRANILFKQKLSGPMQTTRATASAAAGIAGAQVSGPMSLDKLRLARHDVFGRNGTFPVNGGVVASISGNGSPVPPAKHAVTGGRTVAHVSRDSSLA